MVQADKTGFVQPVEAMNIFVTGLFTTKSYKRGNHPRALQTGEQFFNKHIPVLA